MAGTTLTGLIGDIYAAFDRVNREPVGMVRAVTLDAQAAAAAIGQLVTSPVAPAAAATDVTAGQLPPDDGAQTIGKVQLQITKSRRVPVRWTGEEELSVATPSKRALGIRSQQIAQAIRTLVNEVEADVMNSQALASRAVGTPGATPFATDLSDIANVRQVLVDNGAPLDDLQLVVNTTAGAKLRSNGYTVNASTAGTDATLRDGDLLPLLGVNVRESAATKTPTKGTGAAYTTSGTALAVGATSIPLITGTGTVLAGDVVTFAGDANKYVVTTGVAAPGTIVLAAPGLRQAIPAAATAMTVANTGARNLAFARSAIVLALRTPATPPEGDLAIDRMTVQDPISGIIVEISIYPGYRQLQYEVSVAWGYQNVKADHTAILFG